jgi:hypothetical protein
MPVKHPSAPSINGAVAAFKSSSKRGEAGPEQGDNPATMPGPGAYYSLKPILPPNGSGHEGANAVFKEPSQKHYCAVHKDLPMASEKAREVLGDFASVVAKECLGQRPTDLPGPGIYDQDRDTIWRGKDIGASGHSSFQPGSKRTDWGSKDFAAFPGPGHYAVTETKLEQKLKLTSAKSSFVSATEQHTFAELPKGPGPCYYKQPPLPLEAHRSFLLNSRKRWL